MALGNNFGQMAATTSAIGILTRPTGLEGLSTAMERLTRDNSNMEWVMGSEFIIITTEQNTKENGLMTNSMATGWRHGRTVQAILDSFMSQPRMERGSLSGPRAMSTRESLRIICSMVLASSPGTTAESTKAIGKTIKCTGWESLYGQTARLTRASTSKIRRKAMGKWNGRMEGFTKEPGSKAKCTGRESYTTQIKKLMLNMCLENKKYDTNYYLLIFNEKNK